MTEKSKKKPWDAVQYLYDNYVKGDPKMEDLLDKARESGNIARKIYDIRTQKGYSHQQIAKKIGISTSTISMLENADYGALMQDLLENTEKEIKHVGDKRSRKSKKSRY